MNSQQQHEDEPLPIEITPAMAYDLLKIIDYIPKSGDEARLEEVVAMAFRYFRTRLESGDVRFVEDDQTPSGSRSGNLRS